MSAVESKIHGKLFGAAALCTVLFCGLIAANLHASAPLLEPYGPEPDGEHYNLFGLGGANADDGATRMPITDVFPHGIDFGDETHTDIWVGSNGYITFGQPFGEYFPEGITGFNRGFPIVAAQFDDLDPQKGGSVRYNQNPDGHYVVATYLNLAPFDTPVGYGSAAAGTTLQIVLRRLDDYSAANRSFQIELRYHDIGWHQAQIIAPLWATAGWSEGDAITYEELPQSGTSSFHLVQDGSNVGITGVYRWNVEGGRVIGPPLDGNVVVVGGMVGQRTGAVLTTEDGEVWTRRDSGTRRELYAVADGAGAFVAVGRWGTVIRSDNGTAWSQQTTRASAHLYGIAYGAETFVAVGERGTILTSPDGRAWTAQRSGTRNPLRGVTYGDGRFVAVGSRGELLTSADGRAWQVRNSGTGARLNAVAWAGDSYVAVGQWGTVLVSTDAVEWTQRDAGPVVHLNAVAAGDGAFVTVGESGVILTSMQSPYESWTQRGAEGVSHDLRGVSRGEGAFVAVGQHGMILTSREGVQWTPQESGVMTYLNAITGR